jgi:hypothetical protein
MLWSPKELETCLINKKQPERGGALLSCSLQNPPLGVRWETDQQYSQR